MPSWWDRFGQEWAHLGLTDDPTNAQADAGWAFIGQAPPTVEQFNSMFQWSDDKDNYLYGQIANCIISSGQTPVYNDLTQLWKAIKSLQRKQLNTDTAFYIDAVNGNDTTGDGSMGAPWKTIQHAINYIYTDIDPAGHACVLQLAPGTYESAYHWQTINGQMILQGDPLNPRAYLIKNTGGFAVGVVSAAVLYIIGVSLEGGRTQPQADYTPQGIGLFVDRGGTVLYDSIAFGPCTDYHIQCAVGAYCWPLHGAATAYSIYGGGVAHIVCFVNAVVTLARINVTIQNNPAFTEAYYVVFQGGVMNAWNIIYNGTTIGPKYVVTSGGNLNTQGGLNSIPGTQPGYVDAATFAIAA